MKIAFISDIHGNLPALEAVKKDILQRGVDQIVNLGDSLSGPLLPRETAQFIMAEGWYSLAGNHERQILAEEGFPSDFPLQLHLRLDKFRRSEAMPALYRLRDRLGPDKSLFLFQNETELPPPR